MVCPEAYAGRFFDPTQEEEAMRFFVAVGLLLVGGLCCGTAVASDPPCSAPPVVQEPARSAPQYATTLERTNIGGPFMLMRDKWVTTGPGYSERFYRAPLWARRHTTRDTPTYRENIHTIYAFGVIPIPFGHHVELKDYNPCPPPRFCYPYELADVI